MSFCRSDGKSSKLLCYVHISGRFIILSMWIENNRKLERTHRMRTEECVIAQCFFIGRWPTLSFALSAIVKSVCQSGVRSLRWMLDDQTAFLPKWTQHERGGWRVSRASSTSGKKCSFDWSTSPAYPLLCPKVSPKGGNPDMLQLLCSSLLQ